MSRTVLIVVAVLAIAALAIWWADANAQQSMSVAPAPNMYAQTCRSHFNGDIASIVCDSSRVCPHGYALHTQMLHPLGPENLQELFGYGDANEVLNECMPRSMRPGLTLDGGRHYESNVEVVK